MNEVTKKRPPNPLTLPQVDTNTVPNSKISDLNMTHGFPQVRSFLKMLLDFEYLSFKTQTTKFSSWWINLHHHLRGCTLFKSLTHLIPKPPPLWVSQSFPNLVNVSPSYLALFSTTFFSKQLLMDLRIDSVKRRHCI